MDVLDLHVCGSSLMPYCHFELEPSDYLTERASGGDLPSRGGEPFGSTSIDLASTRVIEFSACGVGLKNVRYAVN
jgi:hydrocephalus-inducing protein